MRKHVRAQTRALFKKFHKELERAARSGDAESIHDLRVAIRRLRQCLRTFRVFFPRAKAKKARRELKRLMDMAAEVRNRDIGAALMLAAGLSNGSPLLAHVQEERHRAHSILVARIRRSSRRYSRKDWRGWLEI